MHKILKVFLISILGIGVIANLISYNIFFDLNLYKVKDSEGNSTKFYIVNEEKAQDIFDKYELEEEEEEFNIFRFFEKLNGDFKFEY